MTLLHISHSQGCQFGHMTHHAAFVVQDLGLTQIWGGVLLLGLLGGLNGMSYTDMSFIAVVHFLDTLLLLMTSSVLVPQVLKCSPDCANREPSLASHQFVMMT